MAYTPGNIQQGPGDIYYDCTVPADQTLIVLTSGVPNGGTHVGATEGDIESEYVVEKDNIKIEQNSSFVDSYNKEERITMRFTLKEYTDTLLNKFIMQSTAITCTNPTQAGIHVGNLPVTTLLDGICAVSAVRGSTANYHVVLIYKATVTIGVISLGRNGQTLIPVVVEGIAVTTRTAGDQLFQMFKQTGESV